MLRLFVLAAALCLRANAGADLPTLDDAVQHMYDFDFPSTYQILDRYITVHPQDPLPYAFRSSAYLFSELDRLGVLESEFLIDDNRIVERRARRLPIPTFASISSKPWMTPGRAPTLHSRPIRRTATPCSP